MRCLIATLSILAFAVSTLSAAALGLQTLAMTEVSSATKEKPRHVRTYAKGPARLRSVKVHVDMLSVLDERTGWRDLDLTTCQVSQLSNG